MADDIICDETPDGEGAIRELCAVIIDQSPNDAYVPEGRITYGALRAVYAALASARRAANLPGSG